MLDVLRIMVDIFQLRSSARIGKKGERWACEEDAFSPRRQVKPTITVRVLNEKHWDPSTCFCIPSCKHLLSEMR